MSRYATPMMQQYESFKLQYPDCMILFRLGDFYELFEEDAVKGAELLDLTLTARPEGKDGRVPMAGVPFHAVDNYIAKLVKHGFKIALCEQVGEIPKYGIVKREVTRIITPGTVLDEKSLERKQHNYSMSIILENNLIACAIIDISTGESAIGEWHTDDPNQRLINELAKHNPSECLLSPELYQQKAIIDLISKNSNAKVFTFSQWDESRKNAIHIVKKQFSNSQLIDQLQQSQPHAIAACAILTAYLKYTQRDNIQHLQSVTLLQDDHFLQLDNATMLNLELFNTLRDREHQGSLLSVIDYTHTAMGGRKLKQWLAHPTRNHAEINGRLDAVESLINEPFLHQEVQKRLKTIPDIERIIARCTIGVGNARDLVNIKQALQTIADTKNILSQLKNDWLANQIAQISNSLSQISQVIGEMILDEPGVDIKNGNMIRPKVNQQLDELHAIINDNKTWLTQLEEQEKANTGITTLKIKYNQVFGFYIEVSKSHVHKVPDHYMRKQTLVNGERFITTQLKEKEEMILNAQEKMKELELEIFKQVLAAVLAQTFAIQSAAKAVAEIDCISGFTQLAIEHKYTKPRINSHNQLTISHGRHAVVEQLLNHGTFVPNDLSFDNSICLKLLTGPNMAGKSVYMRQAALIVLLSHLGSFVPAEHADIPLTDAIFVRSGASDVITSGLSTFMVEMVETAYILKQATASSLIIMDEIGRGTSTSDGMAIAHAVASYIVGQIKAKTLFATHYHELAKIEAEYSDQVENYHMEVDLHQGEPIFLHTLKKGPTEHSYGISVAKKAGLPNQVIQTAINHSQSHQQPSTNHYPIESVSTNNHPANPDYPNLVNDKQLKLKNIQNELRNFNVSTSTPLQALVFLSELKARLELEK